jgi:hypothetical protein
MCGMNYIKYSKGAFMARAFSCWFFDERFFIDIVKAETPPPSKIL